MKLIWPKSFINFQTIVLLIATIMLTSWQWRIVSGEIYLLICILEKKKNNLYIDDNSAKIPLFVYLSTNPTYL